MTILLVSIFWGLNYKTLRARYLRQIDRFHSKFVYVTFGLDTLTWTNAQAYYGVCRLAWFTLRQLSL
jgi:hypothetical protein